MKELKLLKLNVFNVSHVVRTDSANELEGMSISDEVVTGIYKNSWLIPGLTCNDSYVSDNGTLKVPIMGQLGTDVTPLCDASAATGYEGTTYVPVNIDKKVSTKLHGCFEAKGIANAQEQARLNEQVSPALAEAFTNDVEAMIATEGTAFEYDPAVLATNPRSILTAARKEYKTANKVAPNTLVINYDMEEALTNTATTTQVTTPNTNDKILINGEIGVIYGMVAIVAEISALFYMYNWKMLHTPIAKDAVDDLRTGKSRPTGLESAIQVMEKTTAEAGTSETWFHYNFGATIVSARQFLVGTEIVTP